jgi:hypothetical protein
MVKVLMLAFACFTCQGQHNFTGDGRSHAADMQTGSYFVQWKAKEMLDNKTCLRPGVRPTDAVSGLRRKSKKIDLPLFKSLSLSTLRSNLQ